MAHFYVKQHVTEAKLYLSLSNRKVEKPHFNLKLKWMLPPKSCLLTVPVCSSWVIFLFSLTKF